MCIVLVSAVMNKVMKCRGRTGSKLFISPQKMHYPSLLGQCREVYFILNTSLTRCKDIHTCAQADCIIYLFFAVESTILHHFINM